MTSLTGGKYLDRGITREKECEQNNLLSESTASSKGYKMPGTLKLREGPQDHGISH